MNNLRDRLRADTADRHRRIDALLSALSLGEQDGYRRFVQIHALAIRHLEGLIAVHAWPSDYPSPPSFLAPLRFDLDALAIAETGDLSSAPAPAEPVGAVYVLAGSRAGAAYLRRLAAPGVARDKPPAGYRYLFDRSLDAYWPKMRRRLAGVSADTGLADRIVESADTAFACFEAAYRATEQ